MPRLDVVLAEPTCRIATAGNLVLYEWRDAPTFSQIREAGRVSRGQARKHPAGTGLLNLMVAGTPRFDEDVRAETTRITADPTIAKLGVADVVLISGLAGVAVRGFLGTVSLLARSSRSHKVFADTAAAAAWLAPRLSVGGDAWTVEDVLEVAAALRTAS